MIVSAAIRIDTTVYGLPAPARHHDIIRWMKDNDIQRNGRPAEQGFIDDNLGFVNRIRARNIVISQEQALAPKPDGSPRTSPDHGRYLFSEDLW